MEEKKGSYTGIDCFRLIAALLVVAIHISPLSSVSETGDFILTRIIARIAVPFFFMTSGFFVISRYAKNTDKLRHFVKRTALLYGIAILIYLPVNLYNGYFSDAAWLPKLLQDLVFDGTFYHLWYFPATILGAGIAWYLIRRKNPVPALAIACVLYAVGLFGDSYFGITRQIPVADRIYQQMFLILDYTRNGLFMAPVFFLMGGLLADRRKILSFRKSVCGFCVSLLLMLGEGVLLHHLEWQRHDSMYVFLLPCMFFLFQLLLQFRGRRMRNLRTSALLVYVLHPMVLLGWRLLAKLLGTERVFLENSLVLYAAVVLISLAVGTVGAFFLNRWKSRKSTHNSALDRAWVEIDLKALEHNVASLENAMPEGCRLMAVVKAEAYGHGGFEVSTHLEKIGVHSFAVATIDEGIQLRRYGIRGEILILGHTDVHRARELHRYRLMQTITGFAYAAELNAQRISVKTHIKIDTGMHRWGISCDRADEVIQVFSMKHLKVLGIYTHLCCSDRLTPGEVAFSKQQIDSFYRVIDALKQEGIAIPKLHIQSSYGLMNYPDLYCDYVRAGIALYGAFSTPEDDMHTLQKPDLRPVLALRARVALIWSLKKGDSVGYGRSYVADQDRRIAVLPIGYGDGYPRTLSCGKGKVLLRGRILPVVGRVCMDQLAVDVTELEDVSVGDLATLIGIGGDGSELASSEVAGLSDSISNELLCRMGTRLPVVSKYS